jgi:hypothetical protein
MASRLVGERAPGEPPLIRRVAPALPSGSMFCQCREDDRTVFRRFYRARLGEFLTLTYIAVFAGGGFTVFLLKLINQNEVWLFLPVLFWAVAAVFFSLRWLVSGSAPFHEAQWAFDRDRITCRSSILGMGETRHYELHRFWTTQIVRNRFPRRTLFFPASARDQRFAVRFLDRERRTLFAICNLTAGEAQWVEWKFKEAFLKTFVLRPERRRPTRSVMTDPLWDRWQDG